MEVENEEIEKETSTRRRGSSESNYGRRKRILIARATRRERERRGVRGLYSGHHKVEVVPAVRYRAGNQTAW